MSKGYYSAYHKASATPMWEPHTVIHGGSYAIKVSQIDFITWKKNFETGEYWVKFHTLSGKEIRLRVELLELNDILQTWGNDEVIYYGEENDNEKRNE